MFVFVVLALLLGCSGWFLGGRLQSKEPTCIISLYNVLVTVVGSKNPIHFIHKEIYFER